MPDRGKPHRLMFSDTPNSSMSSTEVPFDSEGYAPFASFSYVIDGSNSSTAALNRAADLVQVVLRASYVCLQRFPFERLPCTQSSCDNFPLY